MIVIGLLLTCVYSQAIPVFSVIAGGALEAFQDYPNDDEKFADAVVERISVGFI